MKNQLIKVVVLNILLGIILLVAFYLSAFLSGYGSNIGYLTQEKKLFIKFIALHLIINLFELYRYNQINAIRFLSSLVTIAFLYTIAAWHFEYFS